jgi:hypothetical protein
MLISDPDLHQRMRREALWMFIEEVCTSTNHIGVPFIHTPIYHLDTYQFAYFLRETEPHSVLLKVVLRA